jgi:glutamyl-tRNA synthetase
LLRIDDLDSPRNRAGATDSILEDLQWLGLTWDGPPVFQGQRRGLYASVLSALRRDGLLYPCRCSRRLLADISAPHGRLSVYPGFCRGLPPLWGPQNQRLPSWRLRLPATTLYWQERVAAEGCMDGIHQVGDLVLRRADGLIAYHLATAVDELALGISDVLRGADLWSATGAQVAVMGVLGHAPPRYSHVPLWHDKQGQRLSKREGSAGLSGLRAQGLDAPGVIGLLAASAGLVPQGSRLSSNELLQEIDGSPIFG